MAASVTKTRSRARQKARRRSAVSARKKEELAQKISIRLGILREWLGLSQHEMAAKLDMSTHTYQEWERPGCRKWRGIVFPWKVCRVTGASVDWLCFGGYSNQPPSVVPLMVGGKPMPPIMRH
jgi:DNA-binding transcriptional regulator YiaG